VNPPRPDDGPLTVDGGAPTVDGRIRRRSLWHHRDFLALWTGQAVSRAGSQVSLLALPLVAIVLLHATTFEVGALTATATLPFLLVGLPAGALVDRLPRRRVLIVADVGRCAALASVPVAWAAGSLTVGQLYVVSLVAGSLSVLFDVAYQSYLPELVAADQLVEGNGKLAATDAGAQVAGPGIAGLLIGAVGAANAVSADAASYVVSFVSLMLVRARPHERAREPRTTKLRREIAEGLRFVRGEPRILAVAGATATSNLFSSMAEAVLLVFAVRRLGLSAGRLGIIFALANVGALLGAVSAARIARRIGVGPTIVWSIAMAGLGPLAYPLATRSSAAVLILAGGAVMGFGGVVYNVNQVSVRQTLCPPRLQGRMNATVRFIVWGTMPLGGFAGGALGTLVGLRPTLWIAAIGGLGAFLWLLPSPIPGMRHMPEHVDDALGGAEPSGSQPAVG